MTSTRAVKRRTREALARLARAILEDEEGQPLPCNGCEYWRTCATGQACAVFYNYTRDKTTAPVRGDQVPSISMYKKSFRGGIDHERRRTNKPPHSVGAHGALPYPVEGRPLASAMVPHPRRCNGKSAGTGGPPT